MTRLAVTVRLTPEDVAALRFGVSGLLLAPFLAVNWPRCRGGVQAGSCRWW